MRRLDPNTIKYTNCTCWTVGRRRTEIKQRRFDSYKKETEHYVPSLLSLFRKIMIGFTPKEQRRVRYYGKIPPKRVHNICKGWQPNEPTMIVFRFQHDLHSPRYPSLPAFETIPRAMRKSLSFCARALLSCVSIRGTLIFIAKKSSPRIKIAYRSVLNRIYLLYLPNKPWN